MKRRNRRAKNQINVRFTDEDVENLEKCQKLLAGTSQVHTFRMLMGMFLGKVPEFPKQKRGKK